jgi:hypothetical protein
VSAGGKGEMPVRLSCYVEPVRIDKLLRIAVRRTDAQREIGARFEHDIAHDGALDDEPVAQLIRALETQTFFDRRCDQLRLRSQLLQRLGPREEQMQTVADEVGRRLMTRIQQEHAVLRELRLRELVVAEQTGE